MPKIPSPESEDRSTGRLLGIASFGLAVAMLATNRWFMAVDDECAIVDRAAKPVAQTVQLFLRGLGKHEHPPLYDLLLHGWLRLTGGDMWLLRLPSVFFYVLGVWALAKAAKLLGGRHAQIGTFFLAALWPYGFHFGRLAAWYSFSFFLVASLTLAYLKYADQPAADGWI